MFAILIFMDIFSVHLLNPRSHC